MAQAFDQQDVFSESKWWMEQWALWVMMGTGHGGASSFAYLIQKEGERSLCCVITDDEALVVDGTLAQLKKRCSETGEATAKYFLWQGNTSAVSRNMKINRKKADVLIKSGIAWVDAHLTLLELAKIY